MSAQYLSHWVRIRWSGDNLNTLDMYLLCNAASVKIHLHIVVILCLVILLEYPSQTLWHNGGLDINTLTIHTPGHRMLESPFLQSNKCRMSAAALQHYTSRCIFDVKLITRGVFRMWFIIYFISFIYYFIRDLDS